MQKGRSVVKVDGENPSHHIWLTLLTRREYLKIEFSQLAYPKQQLGSGLAIRRWYAEEPTAGFSKGLPSALHGIE
jgi:hypothetical protein